jgi:hypothetical protein
LPMPTTSIAAEFIDTAPALALEGGGV